MEPIEKNHINQNLSKLLEGTYCNEAFLAHLLKKRILTNGEMNRLLAKKEQQGNSYANREMYEIIQTRLGGYRAVIDALRASNQTGMMQILQVLRTERNEEGPPQSSSSQHQNIIDFAADCNQRSIPLQNIGIYHGTQSIHDNGIHLGNRRPSNGFRSQRLQQQTLWGQYDNRQSHCQQHISQMTHPNPVYNMQPTYSGQYNFLQPPHPAQYSNTPLMHQVHVNHIAIVVPQVYVQVTALAPINPAGNQMTNMQLYNNPQFLAPQHQQFIAPNEAPQSFHGQISDLQRHSYQLASTQPISPDVSIPTELHMNTHSTNSLYQSIDENQLSTQLTNVGESSPIPRTVNRNHDSVPLQADAAIADQPNYNTFSNEGERILDTNETSPQRPPARDRSNCPECNIL